MMGPGGMGAPAVDPKLPGLHVPSGRMTGFNIYLNDGNGLRWDLDYRLSVRRGNNYAYNSGMRCRLKGQEVHTPQHMGWMNATGNEIEIGPWSQAHGVHVYRRCKVYNDRGLARWMDIFVNPGSKAKTFPVNIYTNTRETIQSTLTSSGKAKLGKSDWAFITTPANNRSSLLHIVGVPGARLRPTVTVTGNTISVTYNITVPAGGTAILCYFESQSRSNSTDELKKLMKNFDFKKAMADVSPQVQKLILNFRRGFSLGEISLDRSGTADTVILANENGDPIYGNIANKEFTIKAFYGEMTLPAEQIVGFAVAPEQPEKVWAVLVGGQVVSGKLTSGPVKLTIPTGGELDIPFSRLSQCSFRITKDKPDDDDPTGPLLLLRSGDRLAFDPAELKCTFATRHGEIPLSGKDLLEISLTHAEGGVHRATFLNGSTLAGLLGPDRIVLPTSLGPKLDISRDMIMLLRFAVEPKEDATLARVKLSNDDELFGALADEAFGVMTEFGEIKIKPNNITSMTFDPKDPSRVIVQLWDKSTLRGRLAQKTLRFTITPGPALDLHVGQIKALACSEATPPEAIVKQVAKHIAALSAANFKDREEAQAALIRMGKSIVPLLKKHLKDNDPEVRQRVGAILDALGSDTTPAPPAQPRPGVRWEIGCKG